MFGGIIYFGIFAALPTIIASILLYPKVKQNTVVKKLSPILFALQSFAVHSLCALLYVVMIPVGLFDPDTQGVLFFFVYSVAFFVARRYLSGPKHLLLYILPNILISAVFLILWIRCAIIYGFNGSVGWLSYVMNAAPFGMAFSGILKSSSIGFLHAITAFMPFLAAFVGAGGADFVSEQKELKSNKCL